MPVTSRIIENYETFGRCLALGNGHVEAYVTIDVGPRVIRLAKPGGPNLFFQDTQGQLTETGPALRAAFGDDAIYRFYGGHRLWESPEYMETTYTPDNDPVAVTTTPDGALFSPPVTGRGLRFSLRLSLSESDARLTVEHVIENTGDADGDADADADGDTPVTLAPWAITQLAPGGVEILPQSKRDTGLLPDRLMALWPYTDMGDPRLTWGDDALLIRQDDTIPRPLKIGLCNRAGWAVYVCGDAAFIKRFATPEEGPYPDGGMNFESFTNDLFIEMETLGPLRTLANGESTAHVEIWQVVDAPAGLDKHDLISCLAFAKSIV